MTVKVNLKAMREMLGWTQEIAAYKIGTTRETYRKVEAGGNLNLKLAIRMAMVFDSTVDGVWEWIPEPDPNDPRPDYKPYVSETIRNGKRD